MSDKIKKLSEAIRLGATFRPQCRRDYFKDGRSCALGAAYEAVTGKSSVDDDVFTFLVKRFGVANVIIHTAVRNDSGWSRERIADWLGAQGL